MRALGRPKQVAIVLGAGGPIGHAFHAGVMRAMEAVLRFDPRQAKLIVGTSAGAQVGALMRAGMSASDLYARAVGEPMSPEGRQIAAFYRRPDYGAPRRWGWPASPRYLVGSFGRPWRLRLGMLAAAALPAGRVDLTGLAAGFRERFESEWPTAGLWITAANLDTGKRAVFGRPDAPATDVGTAVAASSSVPSLCRPVQVGGHRYVDGAMVSTSHADAVVEADVDEILISSPLSKFFGLGLAVRRSAARLRALGRRVLCIEPDAAVSTAMGMNMMDTGRTCQVARATYEMVRHHLRTT